MAKIIIDWTRETNSGHREGWGKIVEKIDEKQPQGAKQFVGPYLSNGENKVEAGAVILDIKPCGSVKGQWQRAKLGRARETEPGRGEIVFEEPAYNWREEYFSAVGLAQAMIEAGDPDKLGPLYDRVRAARVELDRAILRLLVARDKGPEAAVEDFSLTDFSAEDVQILRSGVYIV